MIIKNIRHTGIVVSDMGRALEFYRDLMGLKTVIDFGEEGGFIDTVTNLKNVRLRMVKLVAEDGAMVELLHYASHPQPERLENKLCELGPTHLAFTVADVEQLYAEWSAKGVKCNSAPVISPDGKAKLFFCQDPDGTFLEIVQMLTNNG
jgi:catechol 2,3-dioxygenase-like lactoylglutathione lyase family enzyme